MEESRIDRSKYERVVHIYGDSIGRGLGFVDFEDPSPLSRIQDIAHLLLKENGVDQHSLFIRFAWSQNPDDLRNDRLHGLVAPGDVVVFQDAGPHENDLVRREMRLHEIWQAVRNAPGEVKMVFATTFDFDPLPAFENSRYDTLIGGSGRTMNDITRAVAQDTDAAILDWNAQMDFLVPQMLQRGVHLIHEDGVHPNAIGNFALAVSLLQHLNVPVTHFHSIVTEFEGLDAVHIENLGFNSPPERQRIEEILSNILHLLQSFASMAAAGRPGRLFGVST